MQSQTKSVKPMPLSAVLFDLDGTLLDTALDFETSINELLTQEGLPKIEHNHIRAYVTDGSRGIIKAAFNIDTDHPEFSRLQLNLLENYKKNMINKTIIFKGLESTMNALSQSSTPWGVVTNKPIEYAQPIVGALLPESSVLVCPDQLKQAKPDPEGLYLACNTLGVEPGKCIYVGDHKRDIEAGNAAGMVTIGVEWGYIDIDADNPDTWDANHVARKPEDLVDLISQYLP